MSLVTPKFRASYPNLFKARKNELNGKDEYSVVALFPKGTDLTSLQKAAMEALVKKWGHDKAKWPQNLRSPFRKHEERMKEGKLPDGYEVGGIFINLKSAQRPGVVDQNVQPILDETQFYAGCFAIASTNAFAYDHKGNRGVAFGLGNVQKQGDGDPLGGRTRAEDDFQPIEGVVAGAGSSAESIFT